MNYIELSDDQINKIPAQKTVGMLLATMNINPDVQEINIAETKNIEYIDLSCKDAFLALLEMPSTTTTTTTTTIEQLIDALPELPPIE
jgi:hypothetical protein